MLGKLGSGRTIEDLYDRHFNLQQQGITNLGD